LTAELPLADCGVDDEADSRELIKAVLEDAKGRVIIAAAKERMEVITSQKAESRK
jgi:hypothetical protein